MQGEAGLAEEVWVGYERDDEESNKMISWTLIDGSRSVH